MPGLLSSDPTGCCALNQLRSIFVRDEAGIMSSHHLTIAKASFAAALLRPDVTKVSRDDLTAFHALFDTTVAKCTSRNVQKCKQWIVVNIAPSGARTIALGKFLLSFAKHTQQDSEGKPGKVTPLSRKILHILYILHDVAHHTKYHLPNSSTSSTFISCQQDILVELVQYVVSGNRAKTLSRVRDLLTVWEAEEYHSGEHIHTLRQIVSGAAAEANVVGSTSTKPSTQTEVKEPCYMLPESHGDPTTPYFDLPAGNFLPYLEPGSSIPMRPDEIKPLQFATGPADKRLTAALRNFLKDVNRIEHKFNAPEGERGLPEIDPLGQITTQDVLGHIVGDTYYGWSRDFCRKMKSRKSLQEESEAGRRRSSRSSTRSSSRNSRKRKRFRENSTSRSSSRSISPPSFRATSPTSGPRNTDHWRQIDSARRFAQSSPTGPPPLPIPTNLVPHPSMFPPPPLLHGPQGLAVAPPRPPNWHGPWPPPPPPPPLHTLDGKQPPPPIHFNRNGNFQPPPPPPPGYPGSYGGTYR